MSFPDRFCPAGTKHGNKAERKIADRLGGRQQPGSGAVAGAKGDIKLVAHLMESKATHKDSLSLKAEWLRKISAEAAAQNKVPALAVQFTDHGGSPVLHGSWVMVPESEFHRLIEARP